MSLVDLLKNGTAQASTAAVATKSTGPSSLAPDTGIASTTTSEQAGFSQVFATMLSNQSQLIGSLVETETAIDVSGIGNLAAVDTSQTEAFTELQSLFLSGAGLTSVFPASMISSSGTTPLVDANALTQLQQGMLSGLANNLVGKSAVDTSSVNIDTSTGSELVQFGFGVDGLDQNDLFDSINVLNHIPLVSDYYQSATDTHISNASKLAGSFIYGGVPGLALLAVEVGVDYFGGYKVTDLIGSMGLEPMANSVEEVIQPITDLTSM